jgi:hypothetical protein
VGNIIITLSLWAAWEHEYKYSNLTITFSSVEFPGVSATVFGPHEGHDSAIVNAGVGLNGLLELRLMSAIRAAGPG